MRDLNPDLLPGSFVYVSLPETGVGDVTVHATVLEPEGMSGVMKQDDADRLGLDYDYVAGWITLRIDSSAAEVGITALFSVALAEAGISCNVIAGIRHDHLLVPADRADEAMSLLAELSV